MLRFTQCALTGSVACLVMLLCAASPAGADQDDPALENLFELLGDAQAPAEALVIERRIWAAWMRIDDEESSRLMQLGVRAMRGGRLEKALGYFDRLVEREPDFAEAWNKRATVYYMLEQYRKSVDDVHRTLALEPRHFGALSGLGLIMMRLGREDEAISAFERALEIHPMMPGPRINLERLRERAPGIQV